MRTVFLFLFFCTTTALAQPVVGTFQNPGNPEENILTAKVRKQGLYKTFDEFKRNAPSVAPGGYVIEQRSDAKIYWGSGGSHQLEPVDGGAISGKNLRRLYWGFCSHDTVFVAARIVFGVDNQMPGFIPFVELGRYGVLRVMVLSTNAKLASGMFGALGALAASATDPLDPAVAVLNMNNGNFYLADRSLMDKLLTQDLTIKAEYVKGLEDDPNPEDLANLRLRTLDEYNQAHGGDVKF